MTVREYVVLSRLDIRQGITVSSPSFFGGSIPLMNSSPSVLDRILAVKRQEVEARSRELPVQELRQRAGLADSPRGYARALRTARAPAIIAEVKRASPSAGVIRSDLDSVDVAQRFVRAGAAALSVLTDEQFFGGSLDVLRAIREALPDTPLLRKDFIIDSYQIWEARDAGADAALLIVAALTDEQLEALSLDCIDADLDVLIEVHSAEELDRAVASMQRVFTEDQLGASLSRPLLGINNRDLRTFVTDLSVFETLAARFSSRVPFPELVEQPLLVAESGIGRAEDIVRLGRAGASAYLIGESLMRTGCPGENLQALIEGARGQ